MGYYLNNEDPYLKYLEVVNGTYFIDKSVILTEIIPLIRTSQKYVCITRPRRFGKTTMANMIGAFFSKACESADVFDSLAIAGDSGYSLHLNQYNVIYIDFSDMDDACRDYHSFIGRIKKRLKRDLRDAYPKISFDEDSTISEDLLCINQKTREQFIFILDEWDMVFGLNFISDEERRQYLLFLKVLLRDRFYVAFAYMTGIMPIAKYSSGTELNNFLEYTMASEEKYSEYFGFTEIEVSLLYSRYLSLEKNPHVTREGLRIWYNGYHTKSGGQVYNPRSVIAALINNNLGNYWTSSGPYDEISYYISQNVDAVRDDLALMVSGIPVSAKVREYAAASMNLTTRDEIFSAMVVYGFLNYENGSVSIPNRELMEKFDDMLMRESSLGYVHRLSVQSERMLKATKAGDTSAMAEILEYAHNIEIPLLSYNHEVELTAIINLVYLAARDSYRVVRENKGGTGYVDFLFYPAVNKNDDCIVLELKVDDSAEHAVAQIKNKKYALAFAPKPGEPLMYTGRRLAVGIGYDRKSKKHECMVEILAD